MSYNFKHQWIIYFLGVIILLTMGSCSESKNNHYADVPVNPSVIYNLNEHLTDFNKLPWLQPTIKHISIQSTMSKAQELENIVQAARKEQSAELTNIELSVAKYEVTAYFLNIRADMNATSNILRVVEKGTLLEVLNTTDNGWLTLKAGGYVNGKYTKIYSGDAKKAAALTILSVTPAEMKQPTSIVKSDSGLAEAHIEEILKGTSLAGFGLEKAILEIEEEYGINAYFTIAVMKLESGNGNSRIAKDKNNLFGLNAIDGYSNKAFSFKTKEDSIRKFGQLISKNYIDKGYTTIEKVSTKYCQANPKWSVAVKGIMKSDYSKL